MKPTTEPKKRAKRNNGEGTVCQRADGRWSAKIICGIKPDGSPDRKTFMGKTKPEAIAKMEEFKRTRPAANAFIDEGLSVADAITNWLLMQQGTIKETSYDRKERTINTQIIPRIGHIPFYKITPEYIQINLISAMQQEGLSHSTTKKAREALNACFEQAVKTRHIFFNPVSATALPAAEFFTEARREEDKYMTTEEKEQYKTAALFRHANEKYIYHNGPLLVFMLNTGLRAGEATGLKWRDVNLQNRTITIRGSMIVVKNRNRGKGEPDSICKYQESTKTKNSKRVVPLTKEAYAILLSLPAIRIERDHPAIPKEQLFMPVFPAINGEHVHPVRLIRSSCAIAARAGLNKCTTHKLRHTFASQLFEKEVDIKVISGLMGHASTRITSDIYVHLTKERLESSLKDMDCI